MPVIVVATIRPLPQHRDEVTAAMLAAVEQVPLDVVVLEPVLGGDPAKGQL
jgi:hypothetical protein